MAISWSSEHRYWAAGTQPNSKLTKHFLDGVLHTVGTISVIAGIGSKALPNLRTGVKKKVLTQASMLENRMDRRALEINRRDRGIDDINRRLDKQDLMLAIIVQNQHDLIVQFNARNRLWRHRMFDSHGINPWLRQFDYLPLTQ